MISSQTRLRVQVLPQYLSQRVQMTERKYLQSIPDHASTASTGLGHRPGGADDIIQPQPDGSFDE